MRHRPHTFALTSLSLAIATMYVASAAVAQTPLLEVEKSDATKLLQVNDDAGLVARGALDVGKIPAAGSGVRLMWHPAKAALRAGVVEGGEWDDANVGQGSVAFGRNTTASGAQSTAMGSGAVASGPYSFAMGLRAAASGNFAFAAGVEAAASEQHSVALGTGSRATAPYSMAFGRNATAAGAASLAMGPETKALGLNSVALGTGVTAQGEGSFAFGDRSTGFPVVAGQNEFLVRAFGGIGLNTGVNIGCDLPKGTGAWACTSSWLAKEGFEDVDGEATLKQLATIPIQRWRYLGTEATHLGPTAEDFHAAFGLGESATKIATVDASGVSLLGVQALERRTAALREENAALRADLGALRAQVDSLLATRPAGAQ